MHGLKYPDHPGYLSLHIGDHVAKDDPELLVYHTSRVLFLCSYLVSLSNVFKLLQVITVNVFSLSILRVVILPTRI